MPNLVTVTIRGEDATGPAFASVLARAEALKAKLRDIGQLKLGIDASGLDTALIALRSKLQSLGIADIADVNVQPGRIMTQLQMLKRMIQQQGISDLLDVNLNRSQLTAQLASLQGLSTTIPVHFDVSPLHAAGIPLAGATQNISDKFSILGLAAAQDQLAAIQDQTGKLSDAFAAASMSKDAFAQDVRDSLTPALAGATANVTNNNRAWGLWGFALGAARRPITLFGGALGALPLVGTIGGIHLLIDAIAETIAVIVPATVALGAFGLGAAPTILDIAHSLQVANTASVGFGQSVYPIAGQLGALQDAVHPEVMTLWGEALVVAGRDAGKFTGIAQQTGQVLDQLGARAAAALTSGGIGQFMKDGPADVAKIGDIIANIFGTVGNLLKTVPGYAEVLLSALDDVTKGLEAVTASPITQWLLRVGLAFHGFAVWGGLAATAAVWLGNMLVGLAARFGLVEAGALAFDAVQFSEGLIMMGTGFLNTAAALVLFSGSEAIASSATGILEGALAALDAVNPLVWVGLAAAAIGGLVYWLTRGGDSVGAFGAELNKAITAAPITTSIDIVNTGIATVTKQMDAAKNSAANYQAQLDSLPKSYARGSGPQQALNNAIKTQNGLYSQSRSELGQLNTYQGNYSTLVKAAGGNLGLLNAAGITSNDIMGASKNQMAQYIIEVQGAGDAFNSLALGTGRAAAAQNAMGKAGAASFSYITEQLPALQQITQAEDNLINVITGGQVAFNDFQQSIEGTTAKFVQPSGLADAFKLAKGNLTGLNEQSLAFSNTLYTQAIPSLQKTIDSLQQQGISTGNLTTAVATGSGEILKYTGNNKEARNVMVALINNALGPGTVSLQNLNSWVKQNSTSLGGFNNIVAQSAIKAGTLAGVLENQLNVQFHQALLDSSGASAALKIYTADITHNTTTTSQGKTDRQNLINDLINSGLSAKDAAAYVDGLTKAIGRIPKNTTAAIGVGLSGEGGMELRTSGPVGELEKIEFAALAAGGRITNGSGPTADDVLARLSRGETVVSAKDSRKLAPLFGLMGIPGYAGGGVAGFDAKIANIVPTASRDVESVSAAALKAEMTAVMHQITSATKAATVNTGGVYLGAGSGNYAADITAVLNLLGMPLSLVGNWLAQIATESGGNLNAVNLTDSNAAAGHPSVGLLQIIPSTFAAFSGPYRNTPPLVNYGGGTVSENPMAQIYTAIKYADIAYGGAQGMANAIGHGHGYDSGGWLPTGRSIAVNNTGAPERVVGPGGINVTLEIASTGNRDFDSVMLEWVRNQVRIKGGGNVQRALGRG